MATSLGELFVVLRAKTKQFQTDMKGAAEVLKKHQAGLAAVGAASAALSAGLIMAGKQMAKAASEFEFSITRVGALAKVMPKQVGGISKEFEALKSAARIMGEQTEYSAKEASDGMQFLAMAGFDAKSIIEAMPSVLQLATSGVVDLATAANITSNVVAAMGKEFHELGDVNDVLVNAFTSTNTTLASIGESFKFVGPVAKGAGVKFKELTAAIGLLGNMGIQGSMAGTTMRNAIVRLLKPVGEAKGVIKQLGLNTAISGGKIKSLTDVIRILEKKGASVTQIMTIFGVRAGPGMAALVEAGANQLENLTTKLGRTGTAAQIQAALLNTTKGQMKLFTSAVESLQISMGNALLPMLRSVVTVLRDLVSRFNALSPSTKALVVKIGIGVAAFSALLAALTGLAAVFPLIVAGFSGIAAVAGLVAVPLLAIAVGIAGIILQVGLLRKAWNWNFLGMRTVTFGIIKSLKTQFNLFITGIKGQLLDIAKLMDVLADPLRAAQGKKGVFAGTLEEVFKGEGLIDTAKKAGEMLKHSAFKDVGQLIKDGFANGTDLFGDLINQALPRSLKDGMGKALADLTKGLAGGVVKGKGQRGPGVGTAAAMDFADEMQFGKEVWSEIAKDMKDIGETFKKGAKALKKSFPAFVETLDTDIRKGQRQVSAFADARQKQVSFAIKKAAAMTHDLDADVRKAVSSLRGSFRGISSAMVRVAGVGMELVSRMGEGGQAISNIVQGFKQGGLFGGIAAAAIEILSRSKSFKRTSEQLSELLANLADAFGPLLDVLVPILDLVNAIVKVLGPFIKALSSLSTLLGKGLSAIGRAFKKLGSRIAKTKVGKWIKDKWNKLKDKMGLADKPVRIEFEKGTEEYFRARMELRKWYSALAEGTGPMARFAQAMVDANAAPKWWEDPAFAPEEDDSLTGHLSEFVENFKDQLDNATSEAGLSDMTTQLNEWWTDTWERLRNAMQMGSLTDEEFEAAKAEMESTYLELVESIKGATDGLDEMGDSIAEVNEQLTNVPEGYKVALARFQATTAEGEAGTYNAFGMQTEQSAAQSGITFQIENLVVSANDPTQLADQMEAETQWRNFAATGSTRGAATGGGYTVGAE